MKWNRISVKLSLTLTALFLVVMVSLGYAVDRIFSNFFYLIYSNDSIE
ncbi:hypothetical protein [Paenibacillus alvei]|nr:hypothetical protein [Paenibacillus alvei]